MKACRVTTSWDDGDQLDLRLAELLAKYGLTGTFYPCPQFRGGRALADSALRELSGRFEVGAHTVSHEDMTRLDPQRAREEMIRSRDSLQQAVGKSVDLFCFPMGRYTGDLAALAAEAGFAAARTTDEFYIRNPRRGPLLHVTLQAYPHRKWTRFKHALKYGNWTGVSAAAADALSGSPSWIQLARDLLGQAAEIGGVWHLWGHSWEIEELNLWAPLEDLFKSLRGEADVQPCTNGDLAPRTPDDRR